MTHSQDSFSSEGLIPDLSLLLQDCSRQLQNKAPQSERLSFLTQLAQAIGEANFKAWFANRTSLRISNDEVTFSVANLFMQEFMLKQFRNTANSIAQSLFGLASQVEFIVDANLKKESDGNNTNNPIACESSSPSASLKRESANSLHKLESSTDSASDSSWSSKNTKGSLTGLPSQQRTVPTTSQSVSRTGKTSSLTKRYAQLAEFVVGSCNQLATRAITAICETPAGTYSPLYIYGGVGLGKTHLLEGALIQLRKRYPMWNVICLNAETFVNYFTKALQTHSLSSFRQKFRSVDVLLLDDIDFLNGKKGTQEECLNTMKRLQEQGKTLLITGNRHPRLYKEMSEELISRLTSGLVCRLESPDLETRKAILKRKCEQMRVSLSNAALEMVAKRFTNNVRELEGAVHSLSMYADLRKKTLCVNEAKEILADLERDCMRIVRITDIESTVCQFFGVHSEDIKSKKRTRSVSQPRMLAMYLSRRLTEAAYSEIGSHFGGRNHSTVISAERKVKDWIQVNKTFQIATREWSVNELLETLEEQITLGICS